MIHKFLKGFSKALKPKSNHKSDKQIRTISADSFPFSPSDLADTASRAKHYVSSESSGNSDSTLVSRASSLISSLALNNEFSNKNENSESLGHRRKSSNVVSFSHQQLISLNESDSPKSINSERLVASIKPLAIQPEEVQLNKRSKTVRSRTSLKSVPSLVNLPSEEDFELFGMDGSEIDQYSEFKSEHDSHTDESEDEEEAYCSSRSRHSFLGYISSSHRSAEELENTDCFRKPTTPRQSQHSLELYRQIQELKSGMSPLRLCSSMASGLKRPKTAHMKRPLGIDPAVWDDINYDARTRSSSDTTTKTDGKRNMLNMPHMIETSTIYVKNERSNTLLSPLGVPESTNGQVNQYHLLHEIGSGSYGRVHLCRHGNTGRYYACKVISKSRIQKKMRWSTLLPPGSHPQQDASTQIRREIAVLKKLSRHPNINFMVEVLDDTAEDNIYMIFELCEFGPIMQVKVGETVAPYNEDMARSILRDVLLGLEYLHYMKVIHRDIKPENLLFGSDFRVQIADFGISHAFEHEDQPSVEDKNASPLFSPPEALKADSKIKDGKAADVWSLGITLYCLVHGRAPFEDENVIDLTNKIINDEVIMSDCISKSLEDLLKSMLRKEPSERISIPEMKVHPWVTCRGRNPMLSTEENCIYEEITEEEMDNALSPAIKFVTGFIEKLKWKSSTPLAFGRS